MQAILFDFDGTLYFGTAGLNAWCFARALPAMGCPPPTREKLDRSVGMTFDAFSRMMLESEDPARIAEFKRRVYALVPEYISRFVRPSASAKALLAPLRERAKLAVCSNADPNYLLPMLDALEIRDQFELIWPHRPGYTKARAIPEIARALGADGAIFVGDRLEDVESARAAGVPVAGIRNAAFPWEVDGADAVAEDHPGLLRALEGLLARGEGGENRK